MSYRETRVREAHKTIARRHPVSTIIGPARIMLTLLGLAGLGLVYWLMTQADWASLALWVIPGGFLVALLIWATLWWTGRT
jgi:hypothetical protein